MQGDQMKTIVSLMAMAALAAALPVGAAEQPKPANVPAGAMLRDESRIYIGKCINPDTVARKAREKETQPSAFLPPEVVAALVEPLVDITIGIAKSAGTDESLVVDSAFPATKAFHLVSNDGSVTVNPEFECLQFVTGSFKAGELLTSPVTQEDIEKSEYAQIDKAIDIPRLFFEAEFFPAPGDNKKMLLVPKMFAYFGATKKRFWELGEVRRNLSIVLSFQNAGGESGTAFANVVIPFRDVAPGTVVGPEYFERLQTKPIAMPAMNKDLADSLTAARTELARIEALGAPPKVRPDPKLGAAYKDKARAYCAEWRIYVEALKAKFEADQASAEKPAKPGEQGKPEAKEKPKFAEPENNLCPADLRFAEMAANAKKAEMDALVTEADRVRDFEAAVAASRTVNCGKDGCELADDVVGLFTPVTVSGQLVEVREASAFNKHLATVAKAIKDPVVTAIKKSTPEEKKKDADTKQSEEAKKADTAQDDKDAFYIAKAKAEASYKAWDAKAAGNEKDSSWPQVVADRVAANKAARKAKIDPPYTFD